MYKGLVNSPETTITNNISSTDTLIYVLDPTRVPSELPNLMTLGTSSTAETIKVVSIDGNALTVERGFQGTPIAWNAGTIIARNFTEYDYEALRENVTQNGADISGLNASLSTHTSDLITDSDGVHGLKIESGSWTPYIYGTTTAGTHTYSAQYGKYYKIGNLVHIQADIRMTAKDASMAGEARIGGIPFPESENYSKGLNVGLYYYVNTGGKQLSCSTAGENGSSIRLLLESDNAGSNILQASGINATTRIAIAGTYITA